MHVPFLSQMIAIFSLTCILSQDSVDGDEPNHRLDQLVTQLDHPRFHTRTAVGRELLLLGDQHPRGINPEVLAALRRGRQNQSVEVRVAAKRLMDELAFAYREKQLMLLVDKRCPADSILIPSWRRFAKIVGEDVDARHFFAKLLRQHGALMEGYFEGTDAKKKCRIAYLDPWKIPSGNTLDWALLLFLETDHAAGRKLGCNSRLTTALSSSAMGPTADRRHVVLKRLIEHWLGQQLNSAATRDFLLIAMRYDCHAVATELCEKVWADQGASPATQVTALLVANALDAVDIKVRAAERLSDDRTALVWQARGSKPSRIQTQVADVARVILLHHKGIDPRLAGHHVLQADRLLVFCDHSLGFPDQKSREASWQISEEWLQSDVGDDVSFPSALPSVLCPSTE